MQREKREIFPLKLNKAEKQDLIKKAEVRKLKMSEYLRKLMRDDVINPA